MREAAENDVAAARAELAQAQREHTTALGELRQQIGSLDQQVSALTERAERADHAHRQATDQLHRWRRELADALTDPGVNGQQLTARVQQLLATAEGSG